MNFFFLKLSSPFASATVRHRHGCLRSCTHSLAYALISERIAYSEIISQHACERVTSVRMPLHSCSNNEFNNSRVPRVPGTIFPTLGTRFCYALTLPSKIDIGALLLASSHLAYSQGKFPVSSCWPYWTIYIFRYSSFFLFFFFFTLSLLRRYVWFQLPWYGNKRVLVLIRGSERYRWTQDWKNFNRVFNSSIQIEFINVK